MTIGIIEDDRLLNQALNKFLTDNGYVTVCAHSGREAFSAAADHPDLWLIDIGLPDGNGLDLYRELTAVRKVPAVFLTARDEERDMLQVSMRPSLFVFRIRSIRLSSTFMENGFTT